MALTMRRVDSTSVAALGYNPERRELYVRFKSSSRLYIYIGVPPSTFEQLRAADSKGRFVNEVVKPRYPVRKL
jgi:KTSC domain